MEEFLAPLITWLSYWPAVIFLWVVYRVLRNWTTNKPGHFSWTETVLLILVVVACGGLIAAAHLDEDLGRRFGIGAGADMWSVTGNNFSFTETIETDLGDDAAPFIEIFNSYGDVNVRPGSGNKLTLAVEKTVRASSAADATRMNAEFMFRIHRDGAHIKAQPSVDSSVRSAPREWYRSSVTVFLPPGVRVRVINRWGNIIVHGDSLPVEPEVQHGKIVMKR